MAFIVGRQLEIDRLEREIEYGINGGPRVILIEGEAGIGKTVLLEAACRGAETAGRRVVHGRFDEVAGSSPFAVLADALRERQRANGGRAQISSFLAQRGDEGSAQRVVDALVTLIEEESEKAPLVLALDDLQWADDGSICVLYSLVRRQVHRPVVVVGTARPFPRSRPLSKLVSALASERGSVLRVSPLEGSAVTSLVEHITGARPGPALIASVSKAGGNPFLVTELLGSLMREGAVAVADGLAEATSLAAGPDLSRIVESRLVDLSDAARSLVTYASVLGSVVSAADLAAVLDADSSSLVTPLMEAVQAGLFEKRSDALRFRHDLIREALYDSIPRTVRERMHHDAGLKLDAAGADPVTVGNHLLLGARHGDGHTIEALISAALAAEPVEPPLAVRFLEKVLTLLRPRDPRRLEALANMVAPLLWMGRLEDAIATSREALGLSPPVEIEMVLRDYLVRALTAVGSTAYEGQRSDEVDGLLARRDLSDRWRSVFLTRRALLREIDREYEPAVEDARAAIELAERADDRSALAEAWGILAPSLAKSGRRAEAQDAISRAESIARTALAGNPTSIDAASRLARILARVGYFGRADRAIDALTEAKELLRRSGAVPEMPAVHDALAQRLFASLSWTDALAEWEEYGRVMDLLEVGSWIQVHMLAAYVLAHRGDVDNARRRVGLAKERWEPLYARTNPFLLEAVIEGSVDIERGIALLEKAFDLSPGSGFNGEAAHDALHLALNADRDDLLWMVVDSAKPMPRLHEWFRAFADRSVDPLIELAATEGLPLLHATWLSDDIGTLLARTGRLEEAVPWLDDALSKYDIAGATRDVARMIAELRFAGRRRRGRRAPRPAAGWDSLTPAEVAVVELAAQGMTNPQIASRLFVSKRTVQTHLAHVYAKMGISSRVELATLVSRR